MLSYNHHCTEKPQFQRVEETNSAEVPGICAVMDRVQYIRYISENFTSKSADLAHAQTRILPWASCLVHELYHYSHAVFTRACSNSLQVVHAYDAISIVWNILWSWTGAAH